MAHNCGGKSGSTLKSLRVVIKGIERFCEVIAKAAGWIIVVIMVITVYDVVMRYFFSATTAWAYELAGLLLPFIWLLAGGYLLTTDFHVRMDVLYHRLSPRKQAITELVTYMLFFLYCGLLLYYGWDKFWVSFLRHEHSRTMWAPPLWPFRAAIPVGAGLILLAGIAKYIRNLYTAITGRTLE